MGQVYRAYDATLRRRVAIKLLRPIALDESGGDAQAAVARVLREARAVAALDHPNVVSIFDVGEQDGKPFIVMELVKGRPLRAFVGKSDVPVLERVRWLTDAAFALAAAHKAGLVHRDVKPENVLVREDGVVKVLDFGIARHDRPPSLRPPGADAPLSSRRSRPSQSAVEVATAAAETLEQSTLAGTPAYMSPEQIRRVHVDARADQFSWGVVAYEILSGKTPWSGTKGNVPLLISILEQPPPPLDAGAIGVPASFEAAVMRALSKTPADRFASMDDLLASLGLTHGSASTSGGYARLSPLDAASAPTLLATASAGSLASAAAAASIRPHAARLRRVRLAIAAGGAMVVLAVALVVGRRAWAPAAPQPPAPGPVPSALVFDPRDPRRLTFDQGCEEYPSLSPDGRSVTFDSSLGDDTQIVTLDLAAGSQRRVTTEAGWHFSPTVSPDGSTIAYVRQQGDDVGTWIVAFDGSSPARKLAPGRLRPAWSPDGRALWAGAAAHPERFDVASGQVTRAIDPPPGYFIVRVRELPDGRAVARLLDRETKLGRGLVLYDAAGKGPSPLFADDTEDAIAATPDGRRLLVPKLLSTGRVELWQVPLDGTPASIVPSNVVLPRKGIDISEDGSQVVWSTCSTEQDLASVHMHGDRGPAEAVPLLPKTEWTDEQPAGVPGSSSKLVVVSDRAARRQLWVLDATGKDKDSARRLPTGALEGAWPAVSPDARWVAFTAIGKGIHIVALDGSSEARRLTSGADDTGVTFARDGTFVYFATTLPSGKRAVARQPIDGAGRAETVVEGADRPTASPAQDRIAYVALDGEAGTPMVLDVATRRSRPLSPAMPKGSYGALRFSPDGRRVLVAMGLNQLAEVDVASGDIVQRFASGDQLTSMTYLGGDPVVSRIGWRGDLWSARDPWGRDEHAK